MKNLVPFNLDDLGLDTSRMVILLETKPLTNQYEQIEFTQEQYKEFSDFLWSKLPKVHDPDTLKEYGRFTVREREMPIVLPDNIQSWYEKTRS